MKRIFIIVVLSLVFAGISQAELKRIEMPSDKITRIRTSGPREGLRVLGYSRSEGVEEFNDIDPTAGVAYYWDVDVDSFAYYAQIPIVKYDFMRINFGVIVPIGKDELVDSDHSYYYEWKTRPEFSVSCLWGNKLGMPEWMPLETGAYVAVGAYEGRGFQLGLLRLNW